MPNEEIPRLVDVRYELARYFESFLDENIDEADAHKWIDFDVSHTDWRGDIRYDKVLSIKRSEDFLW